MIVKLPRNTWVDLYDAIGAGVGSQLIVTRQGPSDVLLSDTQIESAGVYIEDGQNVMVNNVGSVGAYAISKTGSSVIVEVL